MTVVSGDFSVEIHVVVVVVDVFVPISDSAAAAIVFANFLERLLSKVVRFMQRFCFVSFFTCTRTPGRNGHRGGLFGTSDTICIAGVGRGEVCWYDNTLFVVFGVNYNKNGNKKKIKQKK